MKVPVFIMLKALVVYPKKTFPVQCCGHNVLNCLPHFMLWFAHFDTL